MLNHIKESFHSNIYAYLVIFSTLFSFLLLWKIPQFQVSHFNTTINDPIKIAELEDKFRSTIAQILGGIAILIGLYLTNKRVVATEKNLVILEQGQITERFTRAIEHLGKDGLEFKLGGIYALERIANESKKDHWPIIEILTAYIRKNSHNDESKEANRKLSIDTQAVLDVLKRRNRKHENNEFRVFDLNNTYLRKVNLTRADLSMANFSDANLSEADLSETNLTKTIFFDANLTRTKLHGADLTGAKLHGADLTGVDLTGANLSMANFSDANLSEADLSETDLTKTIFSDANLTGADLSDANLTKAYLTRANLTRADLARADLTGANLYKTNLTRADLTKTNLSGANLSEADLSNAIFKDTKFDGVVWGENKPNFISDKDK